MSRARCDFLARGYLHPAMWRAPGRAHATAILVAVAVSLCLPPAAADARARQVFSSVDLSFYPVVSKETAARMARGGVRSVRFALDWFGVEASQGAYDWRETDTLIGNLASQGVRSLPVLFGTPGWA